MIKATTTTLWHLLRPTQKYIGTLSSSHTTHAHTPPSTPESVHQHVQQAETLTPQPARRKHTPHTGKRKAVKESPPQPPTQPTTKQLFPSYQAGCLGDDKKHYTPHPHTTNPQHTPTTNVVDCKRTTNTHRARPPTAIKRRVHRFRR